MNKIKVVGRLNRPNKHSMDNYVFDVDGLSPTIIAAFGMGGGITSKIIEWNENAYHGAEIQRAR